MKPPHALHGAPPLPHHPAPQPQGSRLVEVLAAPVPLAAPPDERALITVRNQPARGRYLPRALVTLTKPVLLAIPHLRGNSPVDVAVPMRRGGTWFLDTRPTAMRRLPRPQATARFTIPALRSELLCLPDVQQQPGQPARPSGTGGFATERAFFLGPEIVPGYYALIPARLPGVAQR